MDATEKKIFTLINHHRQQYGLPSLEPSINLAYVARTHAVDVVENNPDEPVRYTCDHRHAQLMWSKPYEIRNFKFHGFEISFGHSGSLRKTTTVNPTEALNS
ncbi:unnamed protein product [Rotaria sp. Silwood1]|nr:unnamed protein product [Rotaria sp. Silwood1]